MKTKILLLSAITYLFYFFFDKQTFCSNLTTLQEQMAFVQPASIDQSQPTQELYQVLETLDHKSAPLESFHYLKNLSLQASDARQETNAFKCFQKIKDNFTRLIIPSFEHANEFFMALNEFETKELNKEPFYILDNQDRGYFYTYVGIIKLLFQEIETATNYLLEARQLLLGRGNIFYVNAWRRESSESFFFLKVVQLYFASLFSRSAVPSVEDKKIWLHFAHLYDRHHNDEEQLAKALEYSKDIITSLDAPSSYCNIELLTKIQQLINVKSFLTENTFVPISDLETYINIVERVSKYSPFSKVFTYRQPMTLLNGILFLNKVCNKHFEIHLSQIENLEQDETPGIINNTELVERQKKWGKQVLSFYLQEATTEEPNEFSFLSNIYEDHPIITSLQEVLSSASVDFTIPEHLKNTESLRIISKHTQHDITLNYIFSILKLKLSNDLNSQS